MSQKFSSAQTPKRIGVIIGSTRPNRIGDEVSVPVKSVLSESTSVSKNIQQIKYYLNNI